MNNKIYEPIVEKINSWIHYAECKPKTNYEDDKQNHDSFRKEKDLDCVLNGGNLKADTIFSLWLPLRFALVKLNDYDKIVKYTGIGIKKDVSFLKALLIDDNLQRLLPEECETTKLLSTLFYYGQRIENTMILPDRKLQSKGNKPYYDYMPYFLHDCFSGGELSSFFKGDDDIIRWIKEENLEFFFKDKKICKENIIDLAGTNNVTKNVPPDINALNKMFRKYIVILRKRKMKFIYKKILSQQM